MGMDDGDIRPKITMPKQKESDPRDNATATLVLRLGLLAAVLVLAGTVWYAITQTDIFTSGFRRQTLVEEVDPELQALVENYQEHTHEAARSMMEYVWEEEIPAVTVISSTVVVIATGSSTCIDYLLVYYDDSTHLLPNPISPEYPCELTSPE